MASIDRILIYVSVLHGTTQGLAVLLGFGRYLDMGMISTILDHMHASRVQAEFLGGRVVS